MPKNSIKEPAPNTIQEGKPLAEILDDGTDNCVRCGQCQEEIGIYEPGPDGRVWLRLKGSRLLVKDMNALHDCGAIWNFHTSDKQLEDLVSRTIKNKRRKLLTLGIV